MKFLEFYLCFHNSCEIWHSFSQTPIRNFLWCYYRLITSLTHEKRKKECNIRYIILVQGFCPLIIKITQFPDGFHLKFLMSLQFHNFFAIRYQYGYCLLNSYNPHRFRLFLFLLFFFFFVIL